MPGRPKRRARLAAEAMMDSMVPDGPGPRHADAPDAYSTVAERVQYIAECMSGARWRRYISRIELAALWGVTETTVRHYAADASNMLKTSPEDQEQRKVELAAQCDSVRVHAMTHISNVTKLPDYGAILKAIELGARFEGIDIDAKHRHEISGPDGGPIPMAPIIMIPPEREDDGGGSEPADAPAAPRRLAAESGTTD